jgi:hypothetical protein
VRRQAIDELFYPQVGGAPGADHSMFGE